MCTSLTSVFSPALINFNKNYRCVLVIFAQRIPDSRIIAGVFVLNSISLWVPRIATVPWVASSVVLCTERPMAFSGLHAGWGRFVGVICPLPENVDDFLAHHGLVTLIRDTDFRLKLCQMAFDRSRSLYWEHARHTGDFPSGPYYR